MPNLLKNPYVQSIEECVRIIGMDGSIKAHIGNAIADDGTVCVVVYEGGNRVLIPAWIAGKYIAAAAGEAFEWAYGDPAAGVF